MFTGLIETVGRVERIHVPPAGGTRAFRIGAPMSAELRAGDSISVNGTCLTVIEANADGFNVEVSPETLRVTSLGRLVEGAPVNLERALRADARLGGHFVLGHVDGVGRVVSLSPDGEFASLEVECPAAVARYFIPKGSIAVDGVSLTMAGIAGSCVRIQLVPFTLSHTTLGTLKSGDAVNLEADVLGKYVAGLLRGSGVLSDMISSTEPSR
jgi:riboflavin synthase